MVHGPVGKTRSSAAVILLTIVTFGIYGVIWQYKSFKELKDYTGQGIGGGLGLLFAILLAIVNVFMLPAEVGNMYQASGQETPVSGKTGWWVLLPLIGLIIWVVKVQGSLNRFWEAQPTPLAAAA
jgi:hypothetical protein